MKLSHVFLIVALALAGSTVLAGCESSYGFDPVAVGNDDAREPRPRSSSQYLRAVFADILGRSPEVYDFVVYDAEGNEIASFEVDEAEFLIAAMDSVGDDRVMRAIVANGLVHSAEVELPQKSDVPDAEAFVRDQFRRYLGREPSAYELHAFVAAWNEGDAVGPHEVLRALVGSREYQSY